MHPIKSGQDPLHQPGQDAFHRVPEMVPQLTPDATRPKRPKRSAPNQKSKIKIQKLETYFYLSQRLWIEDNSPLKICVKSRQTGFSFCNCFRLVLLVSAQD